MIEENVWKGLEESSFKHKKRDIKEWNLNKIEFHPQDIQSWFDVKETVSCSYFTAKIFANVFKDITISKDIANNENSKNKNAFDNFANVHLNDLEYKNKFVAFVNGTFQDVGDKKNALIKKMYDKFGNVDMYVHKITDQRKIILIDTPEFT